MLAVNHVLNSTSHQLTCRARAGLFPNERGGASITDLNTAWRSEEWARGLDFERPCMVFQGLAHLSARSLALAHSPCLLRKARTPMRKAGNWTPQAQHHDLGCVPSTLRSIWLVMLLALRDGSTCMRDFQRRHAHVQGALSCIAASSTAARHCTHVLCPEAILADTSQTQYRICPRLCTQCGCSRTSSTTEMMPSQRPMHMCAASSKLCNAR